VQGRAGSQRWRADLSRRCSPLRGHSQGKPRHPMHLEAADPVPSAGKPQNRAAYGSGQGVQTERRLL